MESLLRAIIGYIVPVVEACGALIVALGVGRTLARYLRYFFQSHDMFSIASLRIQLGQNLVMGLEFQVAADILKTAMAPSWEDLGRLVALIAIRTVLNFILEREMIAWTMQGQPPIA